MINDDEFEDKTVIANIGDFDIKIPKEVDALIPCLVQYNGESIGKRFPLENPLCRIGRSTDNDLTVNEASISRKHAEIEVLENEVIIKDLKSANGCFVNDKKMPEGGNQSLKDQDILRFGNITFKFFAKDNMDGFIQDKIYKMATIDAGTHIFNKQYLNDALETQFKISKASKQELSLIYFDLDHFKKVNDTYGHNAGDLVLKVIADLVKSLVRKDDIFARFGGEEFIIVLPKTDSKTAHELAERILKGVGNHEIPVDYESDGQKKHVAHKQTISIGISQVDDSMQNPKELLESADQKLYQSKQNGRNMITI